MPLKKKKKTCPNDLNVIFISAGPETFKNRQTLYADTGPRHNNPLHILQLAPCISLFSKTCFWKSSVRQFLKELCDEGLATGFNRKNILLTLGLEPMTFW